MSAILGNRGVLYTSTELLLTGLEERDELLQSWRPFSNSFTPAAVLPMLQDCSKCMWLLQADEAHIQAMLILAKYRIKHTVTI